MLLGPYYQIGAGIEQASANAALAAFYLNPADYKVSSVVSRTVKLVIQATVITNAVAPAQTLTVGLYPVSAAAGAEKINSITKGTVVAGSTAVFMTPAKETLTEVSSSAFECPTAGFYCLAAALSAPIAASKAAVAIRAELQMLQV